MVFLLFELGTGGSARSAASRMALHMGRAAANGRGANIRPQDRIKTATSLTFLAHVALSSCSRRLAMAVRTEGYWVWTQESAKSLGYLRGAMRACPC
jgi:hypothetical protein